MKINSFTELFNFIKKENFITSFTSLPWNTGVSQRFAGKGTQKLDKRTEPTSEEIEQAFNGWQSMKKNVDAFFKKVYKP